MHLMRSELVSFSLRIRTPRMAIIYLNSEEEYEDPVDEAPYAQRITRRSEDETDTLWGKLPPREAYVGMPFLTLLTWMIVNRHVMRLPKRLCEHCGIELDEAGIVRLGLTTRGSITTCTYSMDTDGRTIFSVAGWSNFLAAKNLPIGEVVLVTIRYTP
ncbi:uncharacterized protein LOC123430779 [Hordeum vulgare subsp. vulgare]|uniref:uncharacterized protein LOC123430779 n=1 Tax=Hordeum vulgare subsp. vulgare TaxID=112509 RepID=UPI001D1A5121|nr:uncharacterized protein LOC123430779 [Hordeum vulgare subsp. vulgare]